MPIAALSGPQYLREGLKLILSPGLRLFVILPLTVNLLLFAGIIYFSMRQFGGWVDTLMPRLPEWLMFLEYILWPLFVVTRRAAPTGTRGTTVTPDPGWPSTV